jgi:hypothetical protein
MTTTTLTRQETVIRFLATLAGSADRGALLELRYRLEDGQRMGQVFDRPTRLRGLATCAITLPHEPKPWRGGDALAALEPPPGAERACRQTLDRVPDRDLGLEL